MAACSATRRDGQACTAPVMRAGSSVCFAHDESLQQARTEARRKGGRNHATARRAAKMLPARLSPLFDQLAEALDQVHAGDLDPRAASAMAQLARAMVATVTAGEVEDRLRALEAQQPEPAGRRLPWQA